MFSESQDDNQINDNSSMEKIYRKLSLKVFYKLYEDIVAPLQYLSDRFKKAHLE